MEITKNGKTIRILKNMPHCCDNNCYYKRGVKTLYTCYKCKEFDVKLKDTGEYAAIRCQECIDEFGIK